MTEKQEGLSKTALIDLFLNIDSPEAKNDRLRRLANRAIEKAADSERSKLKERTNKLEDEQDALDDILANPFQPFDEKSTEVTFKCTSQEYSTRLTNLQLEELELKKDIEAWEKFYRLKFE